MQNSEKYLVSRLARGLKVENRCNVQKPSLRSRQAPVPLRKLGSRDIRASDTQADNLAGQQAQPKPPGKHTLQPALNASKERSRRRVVDRWARHGSVLWVRQRGDVDHVVVVLRAPRLAVVGVLRRRVVVHGAGDEGADERSLLRLRRR